MTVAKKMSLEVGAQCDLALPARPDVAQGLVAAGAPDERDSSRQGEKRIGKERGGGQPSDRQSDGEQSRANEPTPN